MRDRGWTRLDDGRKASRQDRAFTAKRRGSGSGALRALARTATTVRLQPVEKTGELSPDYRVSANGADLGAAWKATSEGDGGNTSMTRGDIGFGEPVNAALVLIDGVTPWSGRAAPLRPTDAKDALPGASRPSQVHRSTRDAADPKGSAASQP